MAQRRYGQVRMCYFEMGGSMENRTVMVVSEESWRRGIQTENFETDWLHHFYKKEDVGVENKLHIFVPYEAEKHTET
jgi:hypothetical protein